MSRILALQQLPVENESAKSMFPCFSISGSTITIKPF